MVEIVSLSIYTCGYVLMGHTEDGEPEQIVVRSFEHGGEEVDGLSDAHPVMRPGFVVPLDPVVVRIADSAG